MTDSNSPAGVRPAVVPLAPFSLEVWVDGRSDPVDLAPTLVEAVVLMCEQVDSADHLAYVLGAVRDSMGQIVAATDNQGRTWSNLDSTAAPVLP